MNQPVDLKDVKSLAAAIDSGLRCTRPQNTARLRAVLAGRVRREAGNNLATGLKNPKGKRG